MQLYLLKRLLAMIPTLFGILTVTFIVTQFVPGGPVDHALMEMEKADSRGGADGSGANGGWTYSGRKGIDAQQVSQLSTLYGFDKPPLERYVSMLKNFLQFDLGESYFRNQRVWPLIKSKLGVSVSLGVWAFFLTYLVSVPLGVAKAVRNGSRFDFVSTLLLLLGYSMPGFILGVLLIVILGGGSFLDLFPLRGLTSENWSDLSFFGKITDYLWHVTLPVTAAVVSSFALKTLMTKNTFVEELGRQYVLTARAKGLSERQVLWKHVFRNVLLPLVTAFPATFAIIFAGNLLIETLFSLDGVGLLSYESIISRDFPVVLGALYFFTLIHLLTRLVGDVAYVIADPRIKYDAQET